MGVVTPHFGGLQPTDVGTAMIGIEVRPAMTLGSAPSIPAMTMRISCFFISGSALSSRWNLNPNVGDCFGYMTVYRQRRIHSLATGRSLVPAQMTATRCILLGGVFWGTNVKFFLLGHMWGVHLHRQSLLSLLTRATKSVVSLRRAWQMEMICAGAFPCPKMHSACPVRRWRSISTRQGSCWIPMAAVAILLYQWVHCDNHYRDSMVFCIVITFFGVPITVLRYGMKICLVGAISTFIWWACCVNLPLAILVFSSSWARDSMVQTTLDVIARDYCGTIHLMKKISPLNSWKLWSLAYHRVRGWCSSAYSLWRMGLLRCFRFQIKVSMSCRNFFHWASDHRVWLQHWWCAYRCWILRGYMNALDRYSTITRVIFWHALTSVFKDTDRNRMSRSKVDEGIRIVGFFRISRIQWRNFKRRHHHAYWRLFHKRRVIAKFCGPIARANPLHVLLRFTRMGEDSEVTLQREGSNSQCSIVYWG